MSVTAATGHTPRTRSFAARVLLAATTFVATLAVALSFSSAANAVPTSQSTAAVHATAATPATLHPYATVQVSKTPTVKTFNAYGCTGLIGAAKNMYVAAFVLGYCPSVWVLQSTSWGKAFVNSIINGACRVPWIVKAATGGRASTC